MCYLKSLSVQNSHIFESSRDMISSHGIENIIPKKN